MDDSKAKVLGKSEKNEKNFKWSKSMSQFLIETLVEQVKKGNKVDKGFKRKAYTAAARAVSDKFNEACQESNVENHFRTLKRNWQEVVKLRGLSGCSFDNVSKTIGLDKDTAADYIKGHPKAETYINKPIWMYDELNMICGNDYATGAFARGSGEPLHVEEGDTVSAGQSTQSISISVEDYEEIDKPKEGDVSSSGSKGKGKRSRGEKEKDDLSILAVELRAMVNEMGRNQEEELNDKIFQRVMSLEPTLSQEGFTEDHFLSAYRFLSMNPGDSRVFMRGSDNFCSRWLRKFFRDNCDF